MFHISKYRESVNNGLEVLNSVKSSTNDSILCRCNFRIAESYFFLGSFDTSQIYFDQALSKCDTTKATRLLGSTYLRYGNLKNAMGNFDTAIYYFQKAENVFKVTNDEPSLASLYNSMAMLYSNLGQNSKALELYSANIVFFNKQGDKKNLSVAHNNLGLLYYENQDTVNSLRHYFLSLRYAEETNNLLQICKTNTNLGNLHKSLSNTDSAFHYYFRSLKLAQTLQSKYSITNIYYNLGQLYGVVGRYDSAIHFTTQSKLLSEELKIYEGIYYCNQGLSNIYKSIGDISRCITHLKIAYSLADSLGLDKFKMETSINLYEVYKLKDRFDSALYYFEVYSTLNDSLENLERLSEFKALELKFETKLKDEENQQLLKLNEESVKMIESRNFFLLIISLFLLALIVLSIFLFRYNQKYLAINAKLDSQKRVLNEQNSKLEILNSELKETVGIKDKLISVISHDLRSPMASLQGLISLLQNDKLDRKEFNNILKKIEMNLLNFSKFSDNILLWVRGQLQGLKVTMVEIDLSELVKDVIALNQRQIELKDLTFQLFDQTNGKKALADKESISIVLRNLISNAIKFTPTGKSIQIRIEYMETEIELVVIDTGKGMSRDLIDQIRSKKPIMPSEGTSSEKGLGLGLNLSLEFLALNNSELKIQSEPGEGTSFSFVLPTSN